jgi:hypothetical protein
MWLSSQRARVRKNVQGPARNARLAGLWQGERQPGRPKQPWKVGVGAVPASTAVASDGVEPTAGRINLYRPVYCILVYEQSDFP